MFNGFSPDVIKFFKELTKNNNREWYQKNKERYQKVLVEPARELIFELTRTSSLRKLGISAPTKSPLFRLHRDTRFSNDKSPLKNYNGMSLTRSGARDDSGVIYLHIEVGECFLGAGFWHPDPALLTRFRLDAAEKPKQTNALIKKLKKAKLELSGEDTLKRIPRGFEHIDDPEMQKLLKFKSWILIEDLNEKDLFSKNLIKKIENFSLRAAPILQWGWGVVDQWRIEGGDEAYHERLNAKLR